MNDKYTGAAYQRAVADFVRQNVHYCVSQLISELAQRGEECCGEYYEDVLSVLSAPDYSEPPAGVEVFHHDGVRTSDDDCWADSDGEPLPAGWYWWTCVPGCMPESDPFGPFDNVEAATRDAWEESGDEPEEYLEAYEHWIVSDWFADKLAEHGEMVSKDIFGLAIWGRATTGQAISIDQVVCDIYDELHAS